MKQADRAVHTVVDLEKYGRLEYQLENLITERISVKQQPVYAQLLASLASNSDDWRWEGATAKGGVMILRSRGTESE